MPEPLKYPSFMDKFKHSKEMLYWLLNTLSILSDADAREPDIRCLKKQISDNLKYYYDEVSVAYISYELAYFNFDPSLVICN